MEVKEKQILELIKKAGVSDGVTKIWYLRPNLNITPDYTDKVFSLLYVGIYETTSESPTEVIHFLGIELDEDGEDTTNEQFFGFGEIPDEIIDKVIEDFKSYGYDVDDYPTNNENRKQLNTNTTMAKLFQFTSSNYGRDDVQCLTEAMCSKLAVLDPSNVVVFEGNSHEDILNNEHLNLGGSYFRLF